MPGRHGSTLPRRSGFLFFGGKEPVALIPIVASGGRVVAHALVDGATEARLSRWVWHLSTNGYAIRWTSRRSGRRRVVMMHREVLALPDEAYLDRETDHVNRNKLDNRRMNLRLVTHQENQQNHSPAGRAGSTSRFRGVYWDANDRCWRAQIRVRGRKISLGSFADEVEAGDAARSARAEHFPFSDDSRAGAS